MDVRCEARHLEVGQGGGWVAGEEDTSGVWYGKAWFITLLATNPVSPIPCHQSRVTQAGSAPHGASVCVATQTGRRARARFQAGEAPFTQHGSHGLPSHRPPCSRGRGPVEADVATCGPEATEAEWRKWCMLLQFS